MEHRARCEKRRQRDQFCLLLSFASSLQRLSPQHSWGQGRSAPCITSLILVGSLNGEPGDHSWVTYSIRSHTNNFPQAAPLGTLCCIISKCQGAGTAKRSYPTPKARGSGLEEQPHVQGAVVARAQEGLEELVHVQGQEGRR